MDLVHSMSRNHLQNGSPQLSGLANLTDNHPGHPRAASCGLAAPGYKGVSEVVIGQDGQHILECDDPDNTADNTRTLALC